MRCPHCQHENPSVTRFCVHCGQSLAVGRLLTTNTLDLPSIACMGCGYSLRGLSSGGQCPECGAPIQLSVIDEMIPPDQPEPANPVDRDIFCISCQSNLRSQKFLSLCSTCGIPVWYSLPIRWLRFCDAGWLGRIRLALTLYIFSIIGGFLLGLVAGGIGVFYGVTHPGNPQLSEHMGKLAGSVVGVLVSGFSVLVYWLISTPHPLMTPPVFDPAWRRLVVRGGVVLSWFSSWVSLGIVWFDWPLWSWGISAALTIPNLAALIGFFLYLRDITLRIPDRKMVSRMTFFLWGDSILTFLTQVLAFVMIWLQSQSSPTSAQVVGAGPALPSPALLVTSCSMGILGMGMLVLSVWLVVILFRCRRALTRARGQVIHHPSLARS